MADQTNFESHPAPLAYENEDFLNGPDGRPLRILAEYAEPLARFRREKIQDTVVFFGSARFRSRSSAEQAVELLARNGSEQPAPPSEAHRAKRAVDMARYYEDARRLAYLLTKWTLTLPGKRHRFVVTTGGGPGIMEAANRGAREAGGKTIGLNIALPFEQVPNVYITPELNFEFHYFFMRKLWFAYLAKALVVFPGGFGTLDELFEILTLTQTEKLAKKMTVLLYGEDYWRRVLKLDALVDAGAIAPGDVNLFQFVETPEQAFEMLKDGLVRNHLQSPPLAERHQPEIATTRPRSGRSVDEICKKD
ncbi:MAG: TIGR00730 family Rossman fold protein [Acidobacteria bacterium]|nr:MAG: TIGR00730 family Rossman fold protein [Acidobacteriota bacterium]